MRRILLWAMTSISTVVLLFGYKTSTSSAMPATTPTTPATSSGSTAAAATTSGSGAGSATTASTGSSTYTGTVTGAAASTKYGPVQVTVTLAAGRITAVDVVEYPTSNGKDQQINAKAVPELVQETISAQSAKIDMVSGATYTSTGYETSLQSALDQAGVA